MRALNSFLPSIEALTPPPKKPRALKVGLAAGWIGVLFSMVTSFMPEKPEMLAFSVLLGGFFASLYSMLLCHLDKGSSAARSTYIGLDALMWLGLGGSFLLAGSQGVSNREAGELSISLILSLVSWSGLLSSKSRVWFAAVKTQRAQDSQEAKIAANHQTMRMGLLWCAAGFAFVKASTTVLGAVVPAAVFGAAILAIIGVVIIAIAFGNSQAPRAD